MNIRGFFCQRLERVWSTWLQTENIGLKQSYFLFLDLNSAGFTKAVRVKFCLWVCLSREWWLLFWKKDLKGQLWEILLILLILPFVSMKTPGGRLSPASPSVCLCQSKAHLSFIGAWPSLSLSVTAGKQTHNRCWRNCKQPLPTNGWSILL